MVKTEEVSANYESEETYNKNGSVETESVSNNETRTIDKKEIENHHPGTEIHMMANRSEISYVTSFVRDLKEMVKETDSTDSVRAAIVDRNAGSLKSARPTSSVKHECKCVLSTTLVRHNSRSDEFNGRKERLGKRH